METGNLELIITAVSITGTILAAVLAAFGFLHRELRRLDAKVDERFERTEWRLDKRFERIDERFERIDERFERIDDKFERIDERFERIDDKFERIDERFDGVDGKFDGLRAVLTSVQVSVARIEGHLGIGFPSADEPREPSERPDCAA